MTATSNPSVTLSATRRLETGKTDETYFIGNHDFLREVFGSEPTGAKPVVVSFKGNPAIVPGKSWSCRPWQSASDPASRFAGRRQQLLQPGSIQAR